jgi:CheY-like chemotaxis protein
MAGQRILIVEDEAVVARDLELTLKRLGYDVVGVAQFAAEAVGKVADSRPDLVLMDISLQGDRDGVQAAEVIGQRFGTPVVYLTAHTDKATVARAQSTKPAGYLVKPFSKERLHETVAAALGVEPAAPPPEREKGKASILLVDDSNYTQAISLSLLGKQYRVRREHKIHTPAIVVADQIKPQDVQLLKGEKVEAFVILAVGFEERLVAEVERVLAAQA